MKGILFGAIVVRIIDLGPMSSWLVRSMTSEVVAFFFSTDVIFTGSSVVEVDTGGHFLNRNIFHHFFN